MNKFEYTISKNINKKELYIVQKHHHVLESWFSLSNRYDNLNVITLDNHTDTRKAFTREVCNRTVNSTRTLLEEAEIIVKNEFEVLDENKLIDAIRRLTYEEHIDFAIETNIIKSVLVVCSGSGTKNETDKLKIVELFKCEEDNHSLVLTSPTLDKCLKYANFDIYSSNYILDIDLDYFKSIASLAPKNKSTFYDIIRNAKAITIAIEEGCCRENRIDKCICAEYNLKKLKEHINQATL